MGKGTEYSDMMQEALAKSLHIVGDKPEDIRLLTELSSKEIRAIAILKAYNKTYAHSGLLKEVLDQYLYNKVSHNRKGRKEIVDVMKSWAKSIGSDIKSKLHL